MLFPPKRIHQPKLAEQHYIAKDRESKSVFNYQVLTGELAEATKIATDAGADLLI